GGDDGATASISIPYTPNVLPSWRPVPWKSQGAAAVLVTRYGWFVYWSWFQSTYWAPTSDASGRPMSRQRVRPSISSPCFDTAEKKSFAERNARLPPASR